MSSPCMVILFQTSRGIHIEHDPKQNRYSGLPDAWKAAIPEQCRAEDAMKSDIPEFLIPTNHKVTPYVVQLQG